jgi:hypothetical protein
MAIIAENGLQRLGPKVTGQREAPAPLLQHGPGDVQRRPGMDFRP